MNKEQLVNVFKDLGTGAAITLGIVAVISALIAAGEFVNMTSDQIRLGLATPFFIYFCYLFGGLTRSMLTKKSENNRQKQLTNSI